MRVYAKWLGIDKISCKPHLLIRRIADIMTEVPNELGIDKIIDLLQYKTSNFPQKLRHRGEN